MYTSVSLRERGLFKIGCGLAVSLTILSAGCNRTPDAPQDAEMVGLAKSAQASDVEAQVKLAKKFLDGVGIEKDLTKAREWFEAAAHAGSAQAQYQLGRIYGKGLGLPKDEKKAFAWFEKSAAQGSREGIHALAVSYYLGDGTLQDIKKAIGLWERSAALGNSDSELNIGYALEVDGPLQDQAKAAIWYQKAVAHGNIVALVHLGSMHVDGRGVAKDLQQAVSLFERAADANSSRGQFMLGRSYSEGLGVEPDKVKARDWWAKAADGGDTEAQYEIGKALFYGDGVPKDFVKAAEWYLKAAVQGSSAAQHSIGWMYANGEGVAKDMVLGYAWTNLASTSGSKETQSNRDRFELQLTKDEKSEAQRLSSGWKGGIQLVREAASSPTGILDGASSGKLTKRGNGTAFSVNKKGQAITNFHVVAGCIEVRREGRGNAAKVRATDAVNDLALLEFADHASYAGTVFADPSRLRQGDEVVVFGFPLNAVLSSGGNLTPGIISALTGLGNNTSQIQITAPIQPGSSGSPVLNRKGEIVGVVSMKLSDVKMANATGSVGQNANFAVGGQTLRAFLAAQQVEFASGQFNFFDKSTADLADEARKWTFSVECWK